MKRWLQGLWIVFGSITATALMLASAIAWGTHHCAATFPAVIGCAIASYEGLTAGMIAACAALFAGWLAWSAVQLQIAGEERRAIAGRVEVEEALKYEIDGFAEGLSAIWKILVDLDKSKDLMPNERKLEAVIYGIEQIAKENWLSTSRRMVTELGWLRRRRYEELFDGLERLHSFRDIGNFEVDEALSAVRSVSYDFELVYPETGQYFEGLFRRPGKAWTLGYAIMRYAGLEE